MKIAIIGGGWVGCHLAYKLRAEHDITIFEKNSYLFSETSLRNQNRLHRGFHYARNTKTRELCEKTFDPFVEDYGFLVNAVPNNYYSVADDSVIDYGTYKKIFNDYEFKEVKLEYPKIKDCINVDERYIDFNKAHRFFNDELNGIVVNKEIKDIEPLKQEFDLVINCTNNFIPDPSCTTAFYEAAITFFYEKINPTEFDALTVVDGDFFSIYPYMGNFYTVSHVKYTPIVQLPKIENISSYLNTPGLVKKKRDEFELSIFDYYPDFFKNFKYVDYFTSIKSKYKNQSADRYPVMSTQENLINCFTGKIQGIYVIEEYVKNEIARR